MPNQNQTIQPNTQIAFDIIANSLFTIQYKRTSKFFISLAQKKKQINKLPQDQRKQKQQLITFDEDIKREKKHTHTLQTISFINLECSAHGFFDKMKLANIFLDYLEQIFFYKGKDAQIKKLKLNISGFNLNSNRQLFKIRRQNGQKVNQNQECQFQFIHRLKKIIQFRKSQLNTLEIRINNVRYCQTQDLRNILGIGLFESQKQQKKQQQKYQQKNNLINLTYQLSDWVFYKITEIEIKKNQQQKSNLNETKNQLNPSPQRKKKIQTCWLSFGEFQNAVYQSIIDPKSNKQSNKFISIPSMKRFRLELSTLFYQANSFPIFKSSIKQQMYKDKNGKALYELKNKKVTQPIQYFHYSMKQFFKNIITQVMPNLSTIELDFRNWFKDFQMKSLKDQLVNINKKHCLQQIQQKNENDIRNSANSIPSNNNEINTQTINIFLQYCQRITSMISENKKQESPFNIVVVV